MPNMNPSFGGRGWPLLVQELWIQNNKWITVLCIQYLHFLAKGINLDPGFLQNLVPTGFPRLQSVTNVDCWAFEGEANRCWLPTRGVQLDHIRLFSMGIVLFFTASKLHEIGLKTIKLTAAKLNS